jgi:hypothetical protein
MLRTYVQQKECQTSRIISISKKQMAMDLFFDLPASSSARRGDDQTDLLSLDLALSLTI